MRKKEATVTEGQMEAILGLLTGGAGVGAQTKFPDHHVVVCMKHGKTVDEPDAAFYKGKGYELLSDDPADSGHADMCVMGVPNEVWAFFEGKLREAVNPLTSGTRMKGEFKETVELSESKMSLDELTAWSSQP